MEPLDEEELAELAKNLDSAPVFLKAMASLVGIDLSNTTELALQLERLARRDFGERPSVTASEIEQRKREMKQGKFPVYDSVVQIPDNIKQNETAMALLSLEIEALSQQEEGRFVQAIMSTDYTDEEELLQVIVGAFNKTEVDNAIEQFFPKCTRKQPPTLAHVEQLVSILPKAGFVAQATPEAVEGGFVVRGVNKNENGDDLIDAIEEQLDKANLRDKLTVVFLYDFTVFADSDRVKGMVDPDEVPPVLYVLGPDICREPRRVPLTITSALGLATTWYLSIYPFLLNPTIAKRVEEDLALADANMIPDLNWLTDLSYPLFLTFLAIQLLHEFGHQVVARANGVS
jgi:hypothetical protein